MSDIDTHRHDSVSGRQLDPKEAFLGFPVYSAVPTYSALEGTIVFVKIAGGPTTYFMYVMLDKQWRGVNLPL